MKKNCLNTVKAIVISTFLLGVNTVSAQNITIKPANNLKPKLNRFGLGLKLNHLYDVKFTAYDKLSNGYLGEDANGLNGSKTKFDLAFGIDFIYFISPLVSIDAAYDFGTMTAANKLDYYESTVDFLTLGFNFDLKGKYRTKLYKLVPFVRASIATANYDTKLKFIADDKTFNTEKGSAMQLGLGAGLRYHFSNNWHVNLQSEFITTYTDAWDGYNYGSGKDHMAKTSIGIRYTFGKKTHQDRVLAWQGGSNMDCKNYDKEIAALNDSIAYEKLRLNNANNNITALQLAITKDTDGDGIPDIKDHCPAEPANTKDGCPIGAALPVIIKPVVSETPAIVPVASSINVATIIQVLKLELNKVYFEINSSKLNAESKAILKKAAITLNQNTNLKVNVLGFADYMGNMDKNLSLSDKRAQAVANYLIKQGIAASRVTAKPMGTQAKLVRNNYLNRRVEFEIVE
jgi:outer membrane protein OmpA-like peptidoglycan-associated protein/opacity protein-like surface antigen